VLGITGELLEWRDFRFGSSRSQIRPQDSLDGVDMGPGFAIAVAKLFEEWDF
jgi:hypothetical protein